MCGTGGIVRIAPNISNILLLSALLIVAGFVVGALIGSVGIGGVLLLPALNYMGEIPLHEAIPACVLSYIATGAVGTAVYLRHGTVNWTLAGKLCFGGLPGAYLGAFLLPHFSALVLEFGIAALLLASGVYALSQGEARRESKAQPHGITLGVIGFLTGMGSALTGTGGPLLLIPALIWCRLPMLVSIGLAQVIQIPIAVMATLGNLAHGQVDLELGAWLAVGLTGGAVLGAKLTHVLPTKFLHKFVAVLLVAVGLFVPVRLLFG